MGFWWISQHTFADVDLCVQITKQSDSVGLSVVFPLLGGASGCVKLLFPLNKRRADTFVQESGRSGMFRVSPELDQGQEKVKTQNMNSLC